MEPRTSAGATVPDRTAETGAAAWESDLRLCLWRRDHQPDPSKSFGAIPGAWGGASGCPNWPAKVEHSYIRTSGTSLHRASNRFIPGLPAMITDVSRSSTQFTGTTVGAGLSYHSTGADKVTSGKDRRSQQRVRGSPVDKSGLFLLSKPSHRALQNIDFLGLFGLCSACSGVLPPESFPADCCPKVTYVASPLV